MCYKLFFDKVVGWGLRCFPANIEKFLRTSFLKNTSGGYFCQCTEWIYSSLPNYREESQYRSTHRRCSVKKGVLRNLAKSTRKHLYRKTPVYRCFPVNSAKFLRIASVSTLASLDNSVLQRQSLKHVPQTKKLVIW